MDRTTKKWLLPMAATLLLVSGCATLGTPGGEQARKVEDNPLYNGVAPITFDSLLTNNESANFEQLGDRAVRNGDRDKAVYAYLRAVQQGGDKALLFTKIGNIHRAGGNHPLALLAFDKALAVQPDFSPALLGAGLVQLAQRNYALAGKQLKRAVELDRQRLQAGQATVAVAYPLVDVPDEVKPQPAEPRVVYDAASPYDAYNGLGILSDLGGNYEQAISYYLVADGIRPNLPVTQNNLGYSHYLAGDLKGAERYFRRAINLNPSFDRGWRNLALVFARQQRYDEAITALEQVMDKPQAHNTLGYLCMVQGRHKDAERFLEEAISLSPVYYELAYQNLEKNRLTRNTDTRD